MKPLNILLLILLCSVTGCSKPALSTATFQVELPNASDTETILKAIVKEQSPDVELRKIRNTDLFEVSISDTDPQKAADSANRAVESLQIHITNTYPDAKFQIWERAEVSSRK